MQHQDFRVVKDFRRWLDTQSTAGLYDLPTRIMKVGEEFGEAVAAWVGATGQNPRKGITHTYEDVARELADVVFTALVAIDSLGCCAPCELIQVMERIQKRLDTAKDGRS